MGNFRTKLRYVRHPYLIWRAFNGYYERKFSKRFRVNEYTNYIIPLEKCLFNLFKTNEDIIKVLKGQFMKREDFHKRMKEARNLLKNFGGGMDESDCTLLYLLCRLSRPTIVIGTGCGNGFSSAYILLALQDNERGELYSIDLHYRDGVSVPFGKELGWVIPEYLKRRWHLILGESFRVMPKLLIELGTIDVFLHDSRHTYRRMMKEFEIVWPHLRNGGLLLSHDVMFNDAFLDFCDKVHRTPIVVGGIGIVMK